MNWHEYRVLVDEHVGISPLAATEESLLKLEQLANRPDCELRSWAFELVGDAYRIINKSDEARKSYEAALAEFPPTTAADDREFVRVTGKLKPQPK